LINLSHYGLEVTSGLSCGLIAMAYLLLAFSSSTSFDAYVPGYAFLALGGGFTILASVHLSNLFPRTSCALPFVPTAFSYRGVGHRAVLISLIIGFGQSSNLMLLIVQALYFQAGVAYRTIFLIFLALPIVNSIMVPPFWCLFIVVM